MEAGAAAGEEMRERVLELERTYEAEQRRLEAEGGYRWAAGAASGTTSSAAAPEAADAWDDEDEGAGTQHAPHDTANTHVGEQGEEGGGGGGGGGGVGEEGGETGEGAAEEQGDTSAATGGFILLRDGFSDDEEDDAGGFGDSSNDDDKSSGGGDSSSTPAELPAALTAEANAEARAAFRQAALAAQASPAAWPAAEAELRRVWRVVCPDRIKLSSSPAQDDDPGAGAGRPRVKYEVTLIANVASALSSVIHSRYGTKEARAREVPATATGGGEALRQQRLAESVELASVAANLFRVAVGTESELTKTAFANWQAVQNGYHHYLAERKRLAEVAAGSPPGAAQPAAAREVPERDVLVVKLLSRALEENRPDDLLRGCRLLERVLGRILDEPSAARLRRLVRTAGAVARLLALTVPAPAGASEARASAGLELLQRAGFVADGDEALLLPAGAPLDRVRAVRAVAGAAVRLAVEEPDKWAARSRAALYVRALRALRGEG